MKILLALVFGTILISCNNQSDKDKTTSNDSTSQTNNVVTTIEDTLVVDKDAAVYYQPDSVAMEKWKKSAGEGNFETIIDDWSNYMNTSSEYLTGMKLPIMQSENRKVVKFVKADGSATIVRLDTISNFWGVYLFTPAKEPLYTDPIMIENGYKSYFK